MKAIRLALKFLFPADSGRWLSFLKVGLGVAILLYSLSLRADWNRIFAGADQGLLGREVGEAMLAVQSPLIPRLGWITFLFHGVGLRDSVALSAIWWSLLIVSGLLIFRPFSRPTAFLAWFLQLACSKSSGLFAYGADNMMTIGLFYLMIAPRLSGPDWGDRPAAEITSSSGLIGFHRRVFQIHLCFIYFFSGLSKSLGVGWWNGANLWRSFTLPPFDRLPLDWIASVGYLLPTLGILVWMLETTYPVLIWWRKTRPAVLSSICLMHAGIALMMGMYLFGAIMIVLNVAAFGPSHQIARAGEAPPQPQPVKITAGTALRKSLPPARFGAQ
jgi:hypothetical protein